MFLPLLLFCSLAWAIPASCIANELADIQQQISRLQCSLDSFSSHGPIWQPIRHELKPIASIYSKTTELDSQLQTVAEDIQVSNGFNTEDSETILTALLALQSPLTDALNTFDSKHSDFVNAVGSFLTQRVVGGNIMNTRFLAKLVFQSLYCKIDKLYSDALKIAGEGVDSQFEKLLEVYMR